MKIVILQGHTLPVPPVSGGAVEKRWYIIGKEFSRLGHQVFQISRKWDNWPTREQIDGVIHIRIKGYPFSNNWLKLKGLDLLFTVNAVRAIPSDADVIITNTFWAPIIIPIFRKGKVLVNVARMPKGQMKLYKNASWLHGPSSAVTKKIKSELPKKKHSQIVMIPNTLPWVFSSERGEYQKEKIILYCGRIHPEKGIHLLNFTASQLPTGWEIKIIGPWDESHGGGGRKYLQELSKMEVNNNIKLTGPIFDQSKLVEEYKKASIFVYPSMANNGEAFGLAPLEAMSFGCVPVVSNLDCFKDFIHNGENGLLFDHEIESAPELLWEKIKLLINSPNVMKNYAINAIKVRETHSPEKIAKNFLEEFGLKL